jgi:biotin operon repressor
MPRNINLSARIKRLTFILVLLGAGTIFVFPTQSSTNIENAAENTAEQQNSTDWKSVEQALGKSGAIQPGDVYKVSLPRSDLKVTASGVELKPALALGSWIAFKKVGDMSMVMGDLVLTEDEVTAVLTRLQEGGVEITALHNHVLRESPRVMYMHIHAMGDAPKIAKAIHDALMLSKTPFAASPAASPTQDIGIDTKQIDQTLGQTGKANGVVFQYSIARADDVMDSSMNSQGTLIPPAMGVAQAINFQPTGAGKAAITGDFVLLSREVNPVIRALRDNGIEVTALHSHMLTDSPHLFFMHFWANDDAQKLARGLRAALDKVNVKKGG